MLQAGGQRLAFLEPLLHLRSKTFNAHGNNLTAVQRSAKNRHSDLRINALTEISRPAALTNNPVPPLFPLPPFVQNSADLCPA